MTIGVQPVTIAIDEDTSVSGLLQVPAGACAVYVMAHGAGADMTHPFMTSVAAGLAERGVATLRYQFPYMQRGSRRPDLPRVSQGTVRAAVAAATGFLPGVALVARGKSFGGRMTSQAQAEGALPGVRGLAFLGFPLHPAGQPSQDRGHHLAEVRTPMLFLQGTRDQLALPEQIEPLCKALGARATLHVVEGADHAFHVPVRSGRNEDQVRQEMIGVLVAWIKRVTAASQ